MSFLKFNIILCFIVTHYFVLAQDIHFSQFNASPLNLNPALTGAFDGDLRVVGNNKNQWMSFTDAYRTFSISADFRHQKMIFGKNQLSLGLLVNSDKAGDASFGTNQLKISSSMNFMLTSDSSLNLAIGLNAGINQNNVNYNALSFGNQFNGYSYDPNSASGENFSQDNIYYFDFSTGASISRVFSRNFTAHSGFAFNHLNKPQQSFWNSGNVLLERKYTINLGGDWTINKDFSLYPNFIYQYQGILQEFIGGVLLKVKVDNVSFRAFYLGGWIRAKDAGIIEVRFDYRNFNVGISYDINYSDLNHVSRGRGGLELSIIYILRKQRAIKMPYYNRCPVYM